MDRVLTACDNHEAQGGPHFSRAVVVGRYFDHAATVVMCTAPVGKVTRAVRRPCGNEYLILDEEVKMGVRVIIAKYTSRCLKCYNDIVVDDRIAPYSVGTPGFDEQGNPSTKMTWGWAHADCVREEFTEGKYVEGKTCNHACKFAWSFYCECSCAGKNHGRGRSE